MVRRAVTQKATDTMNSTQYRQARHTEFRIAMDAYYAVARNNDATTEELTAAANARTWADREWINAQHIANQMAQAELDAATAKGCEEVVEVVAEVTAAEVTAAEVIATINTTEAFGIAWGADGEVLTYEQTDEAIKTGKGWFDTQGRWVNKAGWEKQHAHLSAKLATK